MRIHRTTSTPLVVSEIFYSIQGESTWSGLPCTFIRLSGCPLRCSYCDTPYAFEEGGHLFSLPDILKEVEQLGCRLVEITGGEPLVQKGVIALMNLLLDRGYRVLLETSGALSIARVPSSVVKILDIKCPDSGMSHANDWTNLPLLNPTQDEIKFVLCSKRDYSWAKSLISKRKIEKCCRTILFSPAYGLLPPRKLASWILKDHLPVLMQLQLHKAIWGPTQRGV